VELHGGVEMAPKNKKKKDRQVAETPTKAAPRWKEQAELIPLIPLAFILLVVPLIMYAKVLSPEAAAWMVEPTGAIRLELSAYYKGIWFLIVSALSILIVFGKKLKGDLTLQGTPMMYPLIIFLFMAVLSTLFSDYRPIALTGYHGRYEGLYLLLGYGTAFYAATQLVKRKKHYQFLLAALWGSSVILSLIGLLQAAGLNPFLAETVQKLMLPAVLHQYIGEFTGAGGGRDVFLTMGNANYAGGYMAMVLGIFLPLMLFTRDRRFQAALLIFNGIMLFVLILTGSRAGYAALLAALVMMGIMLRAEIKKQWKPLLVIFVIFVAANVAADAFVSRSFLDGIATALRSAVTKDEPYPTNIKDLVFEENRLALIGTEQDLIIHMSDTGKPAYYDTDGRPLAWETQESAETGVETHQIISTEHEQYRIMWESHELGHLLSIDNGHITAEFFYHENQFYLIGHRGELIPYEPVVSFGFEGRERMGTYRGYIWSRSIPLMRETLLIGQGPDTFIYQFPQNDYLAVLQEKARPNRITSTPHSLYLQTAINTGVISLGALLALFGMYLSRSFRKYFKESPVTWQNQYGISLLAGCVAYLTAGVFNDSVVGVSAVFWVLLGMGVALLGSRENPASGR
jgi:O-antigen ligase